MTPEQIRSAAQMGGPETLAAAIEAGRAGVFAESATSPRLVTTPHPAVMIDIETMATHSSRALVLSVALVPFTLTELTPLFGDPLSFLVRLPPQLADCRVVDPGTQKWWSQQTPQARDHWDGEAANDAIIVDPSAVSEHIRAWLLGAAVPNAEIWANGVVFDIGNLENMALTAGHRPPWRYNRVRDYRTALALLPEQRSSEAGQAFFREFVGHDPVHDCIAQIWRLWAVMPNAQMADCVLTSTAKGPGDPGPGIKG